MAFPAEMSILHGATNTIINGGVFNLDSPPLVASVGPQSDVISILLANSATAGLLDAEERFDAPKCDEATRQSMLQEMRTFVQHDDLPSVYWLHGPAGVGKSALCQSLAMALKEEGDFAASFFFSRTAPGRNDGGKLIVTLACQLALNIPLLKPILAKTIRKYPLVFKATNAIKMQTLIVDPINQLEKKLRWNPLALARKVAKHHSHPRLILVDGLDECRDIEVQRDLILCIGRAIRQISLPFRFVVASRPESHIMSTFELDPIFQSPCGMNLVIKDLGDDKEVGQEITTLLLHGFAEIRRTHPIRDFLPQQWPLPSQVTQIVAKSSKGYIYPTTVLRYIMMPENRPDQCLERILGLSEVPMGDKPYEPIDVLYRYIFDSVRNGNKKAVWNIFHFLVVPINLGGLITPRLIENFFGYQPGHVQHVLRDLLCIVAVADIDQPITVLHASLPDFLLNPTRCGPELCIKLADAHAIIIKAIHKTLCPPQLATAINIFYRYIFDSVREGNKEAVRNVFHFLVVPNNLGGLITPLLIEKCFDYPSGHVQHILQDFGLVAIAGVDQPATVLHASLPDFLIDRMRSGPLCIKLLDAYAMILKAIHKTLCPPQLTTAIDTLYHHMLDSVPDCNKEAVRRILHFLVIPNNVDGLITPHIIENFFGYPPGHVQHVLQDFLRIIAIADIDQPITVLHASLPDFLLDSMRSGPEWCIKLADARTMIIEAIHKTLDMTAINILYRHIFDSVPNGDKDAVRKIFHFLVVPNNLNGLITPRLIENFLGYPQGHVQHVLQDLGLVAVADIDLPVTVLHASLPDFLINRMRSGRMCIRLVDAYTMVLEAIHKTPDTTDMDILYRHIFDSVPNDDKVAVGRIFHFLVVPNNLNGLITPCLIEKYLHYPDGRVKRLLRDFLSIVAIPNIYSPMTIRYASFSDFLLDPRRSGPFCIKLADAYAMIIEAIHKVLRAYPQVFTTAIDIFYRHIFDSVPDGNKEAVRKISHFLVAPINLYGLITPRLIEESLGYPRGHVQHVLQDLGLAAVADIDEPITGFPASVPDFLLNPMRSGPLHIKLADAQAMIIEVIHKTLGPARLTTAPTFTHIIHHLANSNVRTDISEALLHLDPIHEYKRICDTMSGTRMRGQSIKSKNSGQFLRSMTLVVAYLLALAKNGWPAMSIDTHIASIEAYILQNYRPLGAALHAAQDDTIPAVFLSIRRCVFTDSILISRIYGSPSGYGTCHPSFLIERIAKAHILMMTPIYDYYLPTTGENSLDGQFYLGAEKPGPIYPRLAHILLIFISTVPLVTDRIDVVLQHVAELVRHLLALSDYSGPLASHLNDILTTAASKFKPKPREYICKLIPDMAQYLARVSQVKE